MITTIEKIKHTFVDRDKSFKIDLIITPSYLELEGETDSFVFRSKNEMKTVQRWKKVIGLLKQAIVFLEEEKKREIARKKEIAKRA